MFSSPIKWDTWARTTPRDGKVSLSFKYLYTRRMSLRANSNIGRGQRVASVTEQMKQGSIFGFSARWIFEKTLCHKQLISGQLHRHSNPRSINEHPARNRWGHSLRIPLKAGWFLYHSHPRSIVLCSVSVTNTRDSKRTLFRCDDNYIFQSWCRKAPLAKQSNKKSVQKSHPVFVSLLGWTVPRLWRFLEGGNTIKREERRNRVQSESVLSWNNQYFIFSWDRRHS